jgi:hypothetical protein
VPNTNEAQTGDDPEGTAGRCHPVVAFSDAERGRMPEALDMLADRR